jgi:hypothetical protein
MGATEEEWMRLPGQFLLTVYDVSLRWGCAQTQIISWAIADELAIVAAFPTSTIGGEVTGGLHQIAGSDVRPLFRPFGDAERQVRLKRARKIGGQQCLLVSEPAEGVVKNAADVLVTLTEVERFEEAHGLGAVRGRGAGPGMPPRYDWDGFYIEVIKRLFRNGLPERQKDLVVEMQEWFIANSPSAEAPDESTIRRRIQAIWHELNEA